MKKLFLLLILLPVIAFAQAPRDIDVTIDYDPAPIGEEVTNYLCTYKLTEDTVIGPIVNCDFTANINNSHMINLLGTTADLISVRIAPCNVNGCEVLPNTPVNKVIPPAVDPVTPALNVTVTVVKV